jgi:hypothetical protein
MDKGFKRPLGRRRRLVWQQGRRRETTRGNTKYIMAYLSRYDDVHNVINLVVPLLEPVSLKKVMVKMCIIVTTIPTIKTVLISRFWIKGRTGV